MNEEVEQIKSLFVDFLRREIEVKIGFKAKPNNPFSFLKIFKMEYLDLRNNPQSSILREFSKSDHEDLIAWNEEHKKYLNEINPLFKDIALEFVYPPTTFLNFNYTRTVDHYNGYIKNNVFGYAKIIHIHGNLNDASNPINFGFGDEMDEGYKLIENLNENENLKNFKSFKYSQNSNYKNLLGFIDSSKFQVYIMGHSCGLSDRTLLNTIFEHENCRSIKIFYHKRKDGSDNFTEIIQNISRHFNDKKLLRSKIVNKSLCAPLPQDIRFQEKMSKA